MRLPKMVVPPGGWKYQEGEIWIRGNSAGELIENVTAHRRSNKKEIGDPWKDIESQILQNFPEAGVI